MAVTCKVFDSADFPALQREMGWLESAWKAKPASCIIGRSSMRWWEYCWLMKCAGIQPGMRVLDIGGNHTLFPVALRHAGCEVWEVDINVEEHIGNWWWAEKVDWLRADCMRLPFTDRFFDRVFSVCVGEHIGDTTLHGWAWSSGEVKLLYGCDMLARESIRVVKRGSVVAHTFDFGNPPTTQACGFTPTSAMKFVTTIAGAAPYGEVDYGWISNQRNIPGESQANIARAHTTASFVWFRTY